MNRTGIEYCDFTWNPNSGCSHVSAGCDHCWARRMATRLAGRVGYDKDEPFRPTFHPDRLDQPLRRKKPAVIAVGFMGDLFHPSLPNVARYAILDTMGQAPQHQFLLLTKRARHMAFFSALHGVVWPDNVWLGVSVEDQATADERIPALVSVTGGAGKWASIEPMLGPVDLDIDIGQGVGDVGMDRLDWVVAGAESGPGHRPMEWEWANDIQRACRDDRVPFMLKQAYCGNQLVSLPGLGDEACDDNPARDALKEGGR